MSVTKVRAAGDSRPRQDARRAVRLRQRSWLWKHSTVDACRDCGRTTTGGHVAVAIGAGGRAAVQGLVSCGRAAFCPWCAVKVGEYRRSQLVRVFAAWRDLAAPVAAGDVDPVRCDCGKPHRVVMVTLTLRHNLGTRLGPLWDDMATAWRKVQAGRWWITRRADFGIAHYVRITEVTHGRHGWHPHLHVALLVHGEQWVGESGDLAAARLAAQLVPRWQDKVAGLGRSATNTAQDVKVFHGDPTAAAAEYFSKAALELGRSDLKDGRLGGRTWWQILAGAVDGVADDVDLWQEWERVALRRRFIGWSAGVRDELLAGEVERSDVDVAQDRVDDQAALVRLDAGDFLAAIKGAWVGGRRWADLLDRTEAAHRAGGRAAAVDAVHLWAHEHQVAVIRT